MEADMSKHLRADLLKAGLLESSAPSAYPQPPLAYPIEDVPARTGIPRTKVFDAIRKKELMARKAGRSTIIEHPELVRYIKTLPTKGRAPEPALICPSRTPPPAKPRDGTSAADGEADIMP
jgi:hypothetical protein